MFGKLMDGNLVKAPGTFVIDGRVYYQPTEAIYRQAGYLPLCQAERPCDEEGTYYTDSWQEKNGCLVQVWTETEPPEAASIVTEAQLVQIAVEQSITDLHLASIEQGQQITELELMFLGGEARV